MPHDPHRNHNRAVIALFVMTGLLALLIAAQAAWGQGVLIPSLPEAPLPEVPVYTTGVTNCEGIQVKMIGWDTDSQNPKAYHARWVRGDTGETFAVAIATSANPNDNRLYIAWKDGTRVYSFAEAAHARVPSKTCEVLRALR